MPTELEDSPDPEETERLRKKAELKKKGYLTRQSIFNNLVRRMDQYGSMDTVTSLDKKALKKLQKKAFSELNTYNDPYALMISHKRTMSMRN